MRSFENMRLVDYPDSVGPLTIGFSRPDNDVHEGMTITHTEVKQLLLRDVARAETTINRCVTAPI